MEVVDKIALDVDARGDAKIKSFVRNKQAMQRMDIVLIVLVILVIIVLAAAASRSMQKEGYEGPGDDTIFVSIASYRDADCSMTVKDLFAKARRPERVFVGLCEQNSGDAKEQCTAPGFKHHRNVRAVSIPSAEAKGPTFARYLCSTLYRGEAWYLQIDSHTRFVDGWDDLSISMARTCPSRKPVLTHYPHDSKKNSLGESSVPILCKSKFNSDGIPTFEAVVFSAKDFNGKPKPVPFVSGGFMFAPGTITTEVPFDPSLDHLFQGEEFLYSARLWTSGYDFFTPPKNVVMHEYYREGAPKYWNDIPTWNASQKQSVKKVRQILGFERPALTGYAYALGTARTMDAYLSFAGLDASRKTSESQTKFCK